MVGVRKISEGENGQVFTPEDFEYLPNYIIDGRNLEAMPPRKAVERNEEAKDQPQAAARTLSHQSSAF